MDLTERAAREGVLLVGVEGQEGGLAATPARAFYALGDGAQGQARALAAALLLQQGARLSKRALRALSAALLAGN